MDEYSRKQVEAVEVICRLARTNFPSDTDVQIRANGSNSGSVTVSAAVLLKMAEAFRQSNPL